MKKVAIVGKPNVGKSSLYNRLIKKRDAITSDVSGTTRDVKKGIITLLENREFELLDTGGIDYTSELFNKVGDKSLQAANEADIILYMVDGKSIPDDEDKEYFWKLQSLNKPMALIVNKIDNDKELNERFWEYSEFGAENIFGVSVSHNRGLTPFYKWLEGEIPPNLNQQEVLVEDKEIPLELLLSEQDEEPEDEKSFKVAIIGRVNTGKSSLLNALLKEDRVVVSDVAGTTIDPIDEAIVYNDYNITFVDTAGIRRRSKILGIEKHALNRTESMLQDADIALLMIDATVGVTELDERIAGLIDKYKLGAMIVLNKWDIRGERSYEKAVEDVRDELKFLHYAPVITISAKSGQRVHKILDQIIEIYKRYSQRIPTSKLNDAIKTAIMRHHVPSHNGQVVKIKFATQFATKHPRVALVVNKPNLLHFSYKRYLTNYLRDQFDFKGVPIEIFAQRRGERSDEEEESN